MQYINQTSRCPDNAYKGLLPSQFLPSYFPKLIRAKVHDGNSEGQLHWYKMQYINQTSKCPDNAYKGLMYSI